jgi:hypothetical protein
VDGGHCHQIDMPEIFNKLVLDHLLPKAQPRELNNNP